MGKAALVGITGRSNTAGQLGLKPDNLKDLDVDLYFRDYARAVLGAGGIPVFLSSDTSPEQYFPHLDGVLLSGGTDVDPVRYGQEAVPEIIPPEPDRDVFELDLLDAATKRGLPVLGICRGIQVMNVYAGGTLNQHVPAHSRFDTAPAEPVHQVTFTAGTLANELYGNTIEVNSLHHQTIDDVAPKCEASAHSDDGSVEAIESKELNWLGIQWHPEMMAERDSDPAVKWLVNSASSLV